MIQNYIGIDARIEAIVRSLMKNLDVDLTDYYTKEEVDALIASGGTGLQINYNDLLNRPIIDGLLQSNLDLNNHMLLYNGQKLYCPAVIENIITFDSDVSIPNIYNKSEVDALIEGGGEPIDAYTKAETDGLLALKANSADVYTKTECDEKFGGGGSIPDPLNVNNLTVSKRLNIQSKDTTDESVKGYIQVAGRNTSEYYLSMGLQYGIIDVYPDRVDYSVNNVRFGTSDIVELNYNKETQRNLLSAEHTLDIQAPSISFNGTLENIYTKQEVNDLIAAGGGGTCKYYGPDNVMNEFAYDGSKIWSLGFPQRAEDKPQALYGLCMAEQNGAYASVILTNYAQKYVGIGDYDNLDNVGFRFYTATNTLSIDGPVQASSVEAQTGLVVNGPSVFNMETIITDLNINGSNCNVYTKTEVDAKVAGGVGLLLKGNDTDGVVENINAEINSTPNGFAKMFKSNYNGSYQMQTIFTVKLDTSRTFSLMFPKDSNVFRFQTTPNGAWHTVSGTTSASQTITHEAPYVGEADEYTIGDPVFATGRVCKYDRVTNEWITETGPTDCICEVKPEGTVGEYMGICVGFNENTKSLIFATHGDYYFNVADSSKYKVGDIILLDGTVLKDDMALTGKIMKMIVGKITGKINKTTIAVLKD